MKILKTLLLMAFPFILIENPPSAQIIPYNNLGLTYSDDEINTNTTELDILGSIFNFTFEDNPRNQNFNLFKNVTLGPDEDGNVAYQWGEPIIGNINNYQGAGYLDLLYLYDAMKRFPQLNNLFKPTPINITLIGEVAPPHQNFTNDQSSYGTATFFPTYTSRRSRSQYILESMTRSLLRKNHSTEDPPPFNNPPYQYNIGIIPKWLNNPEGLQIHGVAFHNEKKEYKLKVVNPQNNEVDFYTRDPIALMYVLSGRSFRFSERKTPNGRVFGEWNSKYFEDRRRGTHRYREIPGMTSVNAFVLPNTHAILEARFNLPNQDTECGGATFKNLLRETAAPVITYGNDNVFGIDDENRIVNPYSYHCREIISVFGHSYDSTYSPNTTQPIRAAVIQGESPFYSDIFYEGDEGNDDPGNVPIKKTRGNHVSMVSNRVAADINDLRHIYNLTPPFNENAALMVAGQLAMLSSLWVDFDKRDLPTILLRGSYRNAYLAASPDHPHTRHPGVQESVPILNPVCIFLGFIQQGYHDYNDRVLPLIKEAVGGQGVFDHMMHANQCH